MSAAQSHFPTNAHPAASGGTFRALAITDRRLTVLGALTQQAIEHFGHGPLFVTNLSVTTHAELSPSLTLSYLASADFTQHD